MATSYKAVAVARDLQFKISTRINGALTVGSVLTDTDGNPYFLVGSGTAGQANACIKVQPMAWPLSTDILGNTANQYCPHEIDLVTEAPASGAGQTFLSCDNIAVLLGEILTHGAQTKWYQSANGVAPTTAGITGTPKSTYNPDQYWSQLPNQ